MIERLLPLVALAAATLSAAPPATASQAAGKRGAGEERRTWSVWAESVHTAAGDAIQGALVTVSGGKIVAIAAAPEPGEDADALRAGAITPGLIDLSCRMNGGTTSVEQSNEIMPAQRVEASIDVFSPAWREQWENGVTTVLVCPLDQDVIGGLGIVVKTGGPETLEARTVKRDAVLRGSFGTQPSQSNSPVFGRGPNGFYSRRPTTRMGVEWEWRKAFYDAIQGKSEGEPRERLMSALRGELPVFAQAWTTQDIRTAVFLKEEMAREGFPDMRLIIDAGAEAWREPQLLVRTKTAVVLPPYQPTGRVGDSAFFALNTARVLLENGVKVALSAHGADYFDRALPIQAGYALRGGLTFEEALRAVTLEPARLVGIDSRVGSLAAGKDADLVLWSGRPFEPSSRVIGVMIEGRLLLDPREEAAR